jgi:hypothetical protein
MNEESQNLNLNPEPVIVDSRHSQSEITPVAVNPGTQRQLSENFNSNYYNGAISQSGRRSHIDNEHGYP